MTGADDDRVGRELLLILRHAHDELDRRGVPRVGGSPLPSPHPTLF